MIQVTPKLYLGNMAEFGDVSALNAAGIELAISAVGSSSFPHSATIGAIAVNIEATGQQPDWMVKGIARLISAVYGSKTLAICDETGGFERAAYLVACAYCEKLTQSFAQGSVWLNASLGISGPHRVSASLILQGQMLWP